MSRTFTRYIRQSLKLICVTGLLCINYGCIKEALDSCEQESLLYLKVFDSDTGEDITASGIVDIADLFVFDLDGCFQEHIKISSDSVRLGMPILIKSRGTGGVLISAWGNFKGEQTVSEVTRGCIIDQLSVLAKTTIEGYASCPDNLFFGMKQINYEPNRRVMYSGEIPVSQKNARMYITVRGLPAGTGDSDYYFTVCGVNQGYDFKGMPITDQLDVKQPGVFSADNRDFVTPTTFNLIHASTAKHCMTVNLYYTGSIKSESLIVSVTEDSKGNPIAPLAGQTTNVLIDLTQGSMVTVTVEVTPWDEIFRWESW